LEYNTTEYYYIDI